MSNIKTMLPKVEVVKLLSKKEIMDMIEKAGRVCYKSEDLIKEDSAEKFIKNIIKKGHESVIEHISISAIIITDRATSHQIVRHRIASYSQESQRYCNYSKDKFNNEITFIEPVFLDEDSAIKSAWLNAMNNAAKSYFELIALGAKPEQARTVLPNSTKTELVMTMNLREWRHFLKLRTSKGADPQIREIAEMLLVQFNDYLPVIFNDIYANLYNPKATTKETTKETSLNVIVESLIEGANSFIMKCPSCDKRTISNQQAYIHDNIKREWYCRNCGQKLNNHNLLKKV